MNTEVQFYNFIVNLERKLRAQYKLGFKKNLIVIFDNASIHTGVTIHSLLAQKAIMAITLPQYSPFFNPVESYF